MNIRCVKDHSNYHDFFLLFSGESGKIEDPDPTPADPDFSNSSKFIYKEHSCFYNAVC